MTSVPLPRINDLRCPRRCDLGARASRRTSSNWHDDAEGKPVTKMDRLRPEQLSPVPVLPMSVTRHPVVKRLCCTYRTEVVDWRRTWVRSGWNWPELWDRCRVSIRCSAVPGSS
jgi:hypothetical protein